MTARGPLVVWAIWAATSLVAVAAGSALLPTRGRPAVDGPLGGLWSWDWNRYADLAAHGYPSRPGEQFAFLPLWPALIRACTAIGVAPWAPWLVAVVATGALFAGVAAAHRRVDPSADPTRTAIAFACLPGSALLLVAYPDALVAALIAWSGATAARRPLAALLLLALATAARPTGLLGAIPAAWSAPSRRWRAAVIGASLGTAAAVLLAFALRSGDALAFSHAQEAWHRTGATALPGFVRDAIVERQLRFLLAIVLLVLAVAGTVLLWRRGGAYRPWAVFAAAVLLTDVASGSLESLPRHLALAFPIAWALAIAVGGRRRLRRVVLAPLAATNVALVAAIGYLPP